MLHLLIAMLQCVVRWLVGLSSSNPNGVVMISQFSFPPVGWGANAGKFGPGLCMVGWRPAALAYVRSGGSRMHGHGLSSSNCHFARFPVRESWSPAIANLLCPCATKAAWFRSFATGRAFPRRRSGI